MTLRISPIRPLLLGALVIVAAVGAVAIGETTLPLSDLWHALTTGEGPGALVLGTFRGPRVAVALGAGALLGMAGMLFQTLFRNPLASPEIMGFTQGAGLAVVAASAFGLVLPLPMVAAAGGLGTALAAAVLTWKPGQATAPLTLILVGLGLGFICSALSTFVMTLMPTVQAVEAQRWLIGSLAARDWGHVTQVLVMGTLLVLFALIQLRALSALELGAELAGGLGIRVKAARRGLTITGVLLAAVAVSVAGPVPFVGLMAGPAGARASGARTLGGKLAAAAAFGALILTLADLLARAAIPGIQLPAGVMTGLLGAPYLLWRLSREMDKGTL